MSVKSLIVIGGGPGGYAAALEAARRGLMVTLIDQAEIGGTCLNRGCIPSKFFLSSAKQKAAPPMEQLLERKNALVSTLRQRMEQAVKASAIKQVTATASLKSARTVEAGGQTFEADAIILATGTEPVKPVLFPDHPAILNSTTVLDLAHLPSHLVVLGGGYIGCELACAFQGLGSKVTLIEKEKHLLATQPEFSAAAAVLERSFEKRSMTVWTGTSIDKVDVVDQQHLKLHCSNGETVDANALLLALGRAPNLKSLRLEAAGLALDGGRPKVNAAMQTSVPSIYAIGDLVSPLPLAHAAAREAEVAVAHLAGEKKTIDYAAIPRCIYTWPEAAAVGLSEEQASKAGLTPRVDRYHFAASSKALIENESEGFWVIVSDAASRKILGGLIVGPHATELIHLISLSLKAKLTAQDIADTVFAHPSLSEGFGEAMARSLQVRNAKSDVRGQK